MDTNYLGKPPICDLAIHDFNPPWSPSSGPRWASELRLLVGRRGSRGRARRRAHGLRVAPRSAEPGDDFGDEH